MGRLRFQLSPYGNPDKFLKVLPNWIAELYVNAHVNDKPLLVLTVPKLNCEFHNPVNISTSLVNSELAMFEEVGLSKLDSPLSPLEGKVT